MQHWSKGETILLRNIARSDGTVTTAIPALCLEDSEKLLVTFIAKDTHFKNNYSVSPEKRVEAVQSSLDSAQRTYKNGSWWHDTVRLYLPNSYFSIWFFYNEQGVYTSCYGNLEAPFVRTPIGIDTRDYGLDIVANTKGEWQWKDEEEFAKRLELSLDSAEHQTRVRKAGEDFIHRLEKNMFPFNLGWQAWQIPKQKSILKLPEDWSKDYNTHDILSTYAI